jgi:CHAT domain
MMTETERKAPRTKRNGRGRTATSDPPLAGTADAPRPDAAPPASPALAPKLRVEVVWADITQAEGGVHLVGHYMGVRPQKAELALDRAVSGYREGEREKLLITELTNRGALRGVLGEIVFFPWGRDKVVGVAGMGGLGTFRKPQLKMLARSAVRSVGLLPDRSSIATVLIGSGPGNLSVRDAVQGLVEGVTDALGEDPALGVRTLRIVERYLDRAIEIQDVVTDLGRRSGGELGVAEDLMPEGGGEISPEFGCSLLLASLTGAGGEPGVDDAGTLESLLARLPEEGLRHRVRDKLDELKSRCVGLNGDKRLRRLAMDLRLREPDDDPVQHEIASRVAFWADGQNIHAAAITRTVTVTERQLVGRLSLVESAVERLLDPPDDQVGRIAGTLSRLLVHTDVKSVLGRSDSLVVEVDRTLSRVQWEMLPSTDSDHDYRPLGVARPVARQLRTPYSPRLEEVPLRQKPRVLIIGDPGDPALHHSLPAAREEAVEIHRLLVDGGIDAYLMVGAPQDGTLAGPLHDQGIPPADYFDVVQCLLSGEFDVVHYCGHAQFDPSAPDRAGWVFKGGLLTARELEGMERPPSLIVANACLTGQLSQPPAPQPAPVSALPAVSRTPDEIGLLASLADEFFRRGVCDYIGTAWEIPSEPARDFALAFYRELLRGELLGEAVRRARDSLYDRRGGLGESASVWAAYQHYGDPTRRIAWARPHAAPRS